MSLYLFIWGPLKTKAYTINSTRTVFTYQTHSLEVCLICNSQSCGVSVNTISNDSIVHLFAVNPEKIKSDLKLTKHTHIHTHLSLSLSLTGSYTWVGLSQWWHNLRLDGKTDWRTPNNTFLNNVEIWKNFLIDLVDVLIYFIILYVIN